MRTHCAVDQKLKKVGAQHVPVVIVVGVAVIAAHHQTADATVGQERLVDREICQIGLHRGTLLRIEWLAGLKGIKSRRRVGRVIGEGIGR